MRTDRREALIGRLIITYWRGPVTTGNFPGITDAATGCAAFAPATGHRMTGERNRTKGSGTH